jgi:CBS domain-containing protein
MKINKCMTRTVRIVDPGATLQSAARLMADIDAGSLPVAENDRLVGMITDRDITIRAVGAGRPPDARIREVMSPEIRYCFDDDEVEDVLKNMADQQLRRLPVVDHEKRLVGIVSISDLAGSGHAALAAGEALCEIARPSGLHSQAI